MFANSVVDPRTNICWYEVRCPCGTKAKREEVAAKARGNARDEGFSEDNWCIKCKPTEAERNLMY